MSPVLWHTILIDLPIVLVLIGPLLFISAIAGRARNRTLTVPAVMLSIVGASSLLASYFNTFVGIQLFHDVTEELSGHLHELAGMATRLPIAITLLFACTWLICWLLVHQLNKAAQRAVLVVFGVAYGFGCVWLIKLAHQGAAIVDHLNVHTRP